MEGFFILSVKNNAYSGWQLTFLEFRGLYERRESLRINDGSFFPSCLRYHHYRDWLEIPVRKPCRPLARYVICPLIGPDRHMQSNGVRYQLR